MSNTPPTADPTWATAGGAELTDPGSAKRATGFETAEAPAAGQMNYTLKGHGDWIEYLRSTNAPQRAFDNLDFTTTSPFSGGGVIKIKYLPGVGKWYASQVKGASLALYDSDDGITWSAAFVPAGTQGVSQACEDTNGYVYFGCDNKIYRTTTGSVLDCVSQKTLAADVIINGMVRDETLGLFIICGYNSSSSASVIYTATTVGGTWTFRNSVPSSSDTSIATDGLGHIVVTNSAGAAFYYSANGTSYTSNLSPTGTPTNVYWNSNLNLFVLNTSDATDYIMFTSDGISNFYEYTITDDIWGVVNTSLGPLVFHDAASGEMVARLYHGGDRYNMMKVTEFKFRTALSGYVFAPHYSDCDGSASWAWLYDATNYYLAISQYGS